MEASELIESQIKAMTIFDANNVCMNVNECAEFLGVHRNTIIKRIHKGDIKATLLGVHWSIPKIQFLREIINNQKGKK